MFIHIILGMNRRVGESEQDVIRSDIDFIIRNWMCRSWYIGYNYRTLHGQKTFGLITNIKRNIYQSRES